MKRMNLGCGSVQPEGWDNVDQANYEQPWFLNIRDRPHSSGFPEARHYGDDDRFNAELMRDYDYVVCNHMLSDIGHHDLVPALKNIRSMLREGGVLRILVPNVSAAFYAWLIGDEAWFPQDERTGGIDAKFCTFVTWFGESRSVFTHAYLVELLLAAGFSPVSASPLKCGQRSDMTQMYPEFEGITDLDDRCTEALILEARR